MSLPIEFRDVRVCGSGGTAILESVSFRVEAGEAVSLIGPSGAGKTTAMKLVNGLVTPSAGTVLVGNVDVQSADLVALRRRIGYIIQEVGLFPHRTVLDNVATVPRLLGWSEDRLLDRATLLLDHVGLPIREYGRRMPSSLSGGERQRVGIVRALVFGPEVLLCDEPFGALDPIVRRELQETFVSLRRQQGTTILFVTHDFREAQIVADRIVLLDRGSVAVDCPSGELVMHDHPTAKAIVDAVRSQQ